MSVPSCQNEWTGERIIDPSTIRSDLKIEGMEGIGNYAVRLGWNDGHSSGLYTWETCAGSPGNARQREGSGAQRNLLPVLPTAGSPRIEETPSRIALIVSRIGRRGSRTGPRGCRGKDDRTLADRPQLTVAIPTCNGARGTWPKP